MNERSIEIDPADFGCQEARVVAVCVKPDQKAARGETLVEFECDKASFEVSMPTDGTVVKLLLNHGDRIAAKTTVARVKVKPESASDEKEIGSASLELLKSRFPRLQSTESLRDAVQLLNEHSTVSEASVSDAHAIASVYEESSNSINVQTTEVASPADELWFAKEIANPRKTFFKCKLTAGGGFEEKTIGFCNIEAIHRAPRIEYHFIGLYVAGPTLAWTCGAKLFATGIEYCKREGIPSLLAFTKSDNLPAIRLLEHLKFEKCGTFDDSNYGSARSLFYKMDISD